MELNLFSKEDFYGWGDKEAIKRLAEQVNNKLPGKLKVAGFVEKKCLVWEEHGIPYGIGEEHVTEPKRSLFKILYKLTPIEQPEEECDCIGETVIKYAGSKKLEIIDNNFCPKCGKKLS